MMTETWKITVAALVLVCFTSCNIAAGSYDLAVAVRKLGQIDLVRGEMGKGRAAHTATLLNDGRVLIVGGMKYGGGSIAEAEIFDSSTMTFSMTGKLAAARAGHTATLLPNGKVLVAGGYNGGYLQTSEIYDPKTGQFEPGPQLTLPRSEHTATILPDGTVLLVGGVGTGWAFLSEAEIFDPKTGKFTATGSMAVPRESHTATLLQNGKVLITGGHKDRRAAITIYSSTELYDPARRAFESGPEMTIRRHKHDAVLLKDGRVMVTGGSDERDSRGAYTSIELFDPKENRFSKIGDLGNARYKLNGAVTVLDDGKILIAGGADRAEVFDAAKRTTQSVTGSFGSRRFFATATRLKNGQVLITGGYDDVQQVSQRAWIYRDKV
jgi:TATA-box binding protein (TBP) (component of TFIID and TFIIIB)